MAKQLLLLLCKRHNRSAIHCAEDSRTVDPNYSVTPQILEAVAFIVVWLTWPVTIFTLNLVTKELAFIDLFRKRQNKYKSYNLREVKVEWTGKEIWYQYYESPTNRVNFVAQEA